MMIAGILIITTLVLIIRMTITMRREMKAKEQEQTATEKEEVNQRRRRGYIVFALMVAVFGLQIWALVLTQYPPGPPF